MWQLIFHGDLPVENGVSKNVTASFRSLRNLFSFSKSKCRWWNGRHGWSSFFFPAYTVCVQRGKRTSIFSLAASCGSYAAWLQVFDLSNSRMVAEKVQYWQDLVEICGQSLALNGDETAKPKNKWRWIINWTVHSHTQRWESTRN